MNEATTQSRLPFFQRSPRTQVGDWATALAPRSANLSRVLELRVGLRRTVEGISLGGREEGRVGTLSLSSNQADGRYQPIIEVEMGV